MMCASFRAGMTTATGGRAPTAADAGAGAGAEVGVASDFDSGFGRVLGRHSMNHPAAQPAANSTIDHVAGRSTHCWNGAAITDRVWHPRVETIRAPVRLIHSADHGPPTPDCAGPSTVSDKCVKSVDELRAPVVAYEAARFRGPQLTTTHQENRPA